MFMKKLIACLALIGFSLAAQQTDMKPFPMELKDTGGLADVSFLLEKPAGKNGFIGVKDGHFVKPNGERFRVWGINMAGASATPSKEEASTIAAHLARFGLNCIRFHFLDRLSPGGLIDNSRNDTRALDPAQLDRFDFFISELKKHGIYTNLNLNVGRTYKAGDGVRDYELFGFGKGMTYFDERLLMLQKEYAKQLLTHYNPYTKAEYRNEPSVLMIEFVNENSLVESWVSNRLLGKQTRKNPGTWADIPASYAEDLTKKYNAWLERKLSPAELKEFRALAGVAADAPVPRLTRQELDTAPARRFRTELAFYMEIEDNFFQSMRSYLKDELGVKPLLAGTSDHNHGISGYPLLRSASKLDIVDGHIYWQHPSYIEDPATGKRTGFTIGNSPMVNDPYNSSVVGLSRSAVAGKPYTVSEVNHPFPSEYASEGIPILGAYAALQDWDGIFWFTFGSSNPANRGQRALSYFDMSPDPVKMTELASGALMFLRHDVNTAGRMITRSYSTEEVYESLRMPRTQRPYFTPGFPLSLPLEHQVRIAGFDAESTRRFMERANVNPIVSDTKQLAWQTSPDNTGFVTVDTKRYQALVGFLKANREELGNLSADIKNNFGAITLASLDGAPLSRSAKMLLTAGSRVANTGQQWNEKRNSLTNWGTGPVLIEPVTGTVILRNLENAGKVEALALDTAGRPLGQAIPGKKTSAGWEIPIGDPVTTWYAINVTR
jgi:hypothetical protein